jgi:GntR family transcriptional regulator
MDTLYTSDVKRTAMQELTCRPQCVEKVLDCIRSLVHYIFSMTTAPKRRSPRPFALDLLSGVPIYRQIMDQVAGAIATGALAAGDQLPTVRQLAVDLAVNPNTVIRAYRELELQGVLETQQGTGTFIGHQKASLNGVARQRRLTQLAGEFAARAGSEGITVEELIRQLQDFQKDAGKRKG